MNDPWAGLEALERPEEWTLKARCAEVDAEIWFPEKGFHSATQAKTICGTCEVKTDCLEAALKRKERYGVWGSKTPKERELIARDRRRKVGGVRCTVCSTLFQGKPQNMYCSKDCHLAARRDRPRRSA